MFEELKFKNGLRRIAAHFVDGIILTPLNWLVMATLTMNVNSFLKMSAFVASSLLGVIYITFCHGKYGATVGKKLMNLKVLDVSENKLSWQQALLRSSPSLLILFFTIPYSILHFQDIIDFFLIANLKTSSPQGIPQWLVIIGSIPLALAILEWITMQTNSKRRSIHDYIAGSVVIRTDFTPNLKLRQFGIYLISVGAFLIFISFLLNPAFSLFIIAWSNWPFENKWLIDELPYMTGLFFQFIIYGFIFVFFNRKG